ncbi:hypothetical protein C8C83_1367 [Flavobacterium sp. 90]|uniref:hypothetical protein n=1 Tax=unclassified Flavobacterium TaxID=196869 RepID=UPI000EB3566A|nr:MULTISPECIES: hypothetical protein [unclassified Flavobacterium]RKR09719.1 hypothetical protein C8C82_1668 [Flavobacterium sp. 81]TCK53505.1 hypothetical protein C8C83_1367 [Flavobacterium sp. 90]
MSGRIEFYKIDKLKIETNLFPLIKDSSFLESFKEFVFSYNLDTDYFKVSYDVIIEKITSDFFRINHTEFEVICRWIFKFHREELERDVNFLDNLGLIEIGDLHSREEKIIFYCFGEYGINDFSDELEKINTSWNDLNTPSKSNDFKFVIDFLSLVLLKNILRNEELEADYENELKEMLVDLSKNENMYFSSVRFLENILNKNDFTNLYNEDITYMLECSESYLWKIGSMKENIENYNDLIYRLDLY